MFALVGTFSVFLIFANLRLQLYTHHWRNQEQSVCIDQEWWGKSQVPITFLPMQGMHRQLSLTFETSWIMETKKIEQNWAVQQSWAWGQAAAHRAAQIVVISLTAPNKHILPAQQHKNNCWTKYVFLFFSVSSALHMLAHFPCKVLPSVSDNVDNGTFAFKFRPQFLRLQFALSFEFPGNAAAASA